MAISAGWFFSSGPQFLRNIQQQQGKRLKNKTKEDKYETQGQWEMSLDSEIYVDFTYFSAMFYEIYILVPQSLSFGGGCILIKICPICVLEIYIYLQFRFYGHIIIRYTQCVQHSAVYIKDHIYLSDSSAFYLVLGTIVQQYILLSLLSGVFHMVISMFYQELVFSVVYIIIIYIYIYILV